MYYNNVTAGFPLALTETAILVRKNLGSEGLLVINEKVIINIDLSSCKQNQNRIRHCDLLEKY